MNPLPPWQRRFARRLVRHAKHVMHPARPAWSAVMESELEHVPGDYQSLLWAIGCVRASYMERFYGRSRSVLTAITVGIVFAILDELLRGVLAAMAWPHWYVSFARAHKHLGLEVWFVAMILPVALMAAGFGVLLARLVKGSSIALPCISIGVWVIYTFVRALVPAADIPLQTLWDDFLRFPTSYVAGIVLPTCAMLLGYRRAQHTTDH